MTPKQVVAFIQENGIGRKPFADRLGVTEAAISFWLQQGWMTYERQCHVQNEFPNSGLRANWRDVPAVRRPKARAA